MTTLGGANVCNLNVFDDICYGVQFQIFICHKVIFFNDISVKIFGPCFNQVGSIDTSLSSDTSSTIIFS